MRADLKALAEAHHAIDFTDAVVIESGWDFVVVDTGEWVFRVPRRESVRAMLRVERRLLALLGPRLGVPVPDLSLHTANDGTVYGLYQRLPGDGATCADSAAIADDVATMLTTLHGLHSADALVLGLAAPGKLDIDVLARRATAEVVPLLPWEAVTALREAFATLREPVEVEAVIHADLGESNVLVADSRLSAVIDWSDAHVGDPAMDLTWFVQCLGVEAARAAFAGYTPPRGACLDTLWRRAVAHATVQPVHAVLYGLDHGRPSYVQKQLARLVPVR